MANGTATQAPRTNGRFQKGNPGGPGRPKGAEHKTTTDARVLRRWIIESWDRIGADRLLDEYATDNFPAYLKLVANLLPRDSDLNISAGVRAESAPVGATSGDDLFRDILARAGIDPDKVGGNGGAGVPGPEEVSA